MILIIHIYILHCKTILKKTDMLQLYNLKLIFIGNEKKT